MKTWAFLLLISGAATGQTPPFRQTGCDRGHHRQQYPEAARPRFDPSKSAGQVVFWDADKNKKYASRVTGLGRENYFSLQQKQAVSALDADSLLVLSRGDLRASNAANADSIANGNYLFQTDLLF